MERFKEILPYVIIILTVVIIRTFVVTPVRVNGSSMEPNLYNEEVLLLEKYYRSYQRFDVVVLNFNGERLVKRIIGLPGEHVKYIDDKLYINGKVVAEDFVTASSTLDYDLMNLNYEVVPENHYFVMGDNRDKSIDSRFIGPIAKSEVIGKVRLRIFPFKTFGIIK